MDKDRRSELLDTSKFDLVGIIAKSEHTIRCLALTLQNSEPFPCEDCEHVPTTRCNAEMCANQWVKKMDDQTTQPTNTWIIRYRQGIAEPEAQSATNVKEKTDA